MLSEERANPLRAKLRATAGRTLASCEVCSPRSCERGTSEQRSGRKTKAATTRSEAHAKQQAKVARNERTGAQAAKLGGAARRRPFFPAFAAEVRSSKSRPPRRGRGEKKRSFFERAFSIT